MGKSIEWTDVTWNPTSGCSKVSSGCKNCYAERLWPRVYGKDRPFTDVQLHPDRLAAPLRWRKPRMIFVDSMSDLFHEDVSIKFIDQAFAVMTLCQKHIFQILTKRDERMSQYINDPDTPFRIDVWRRIIADGKCDDVRVPGGVIQLSEYCQKWPLSNVWLGVSVEDQKSADKRIPFLLQTPAAVRFVSLEPLLENIDCKLDENGRHPDYDFGIDWVIAGGESGPKARPSHPDWFRSIRDQCQDAGAGIPFFFKQWGEWGHPAVGDIADFTENAQRQEWISDGRADFNMARVGKKRAGRLLDGREWNEIPEVNQWRET